MTYDLFKKEVEYHLDIIRNKLVSKGEEYIRNGDPFWNFNVAAEITRQTPEEALDGMLMKHYVSYRDMLNDIKEGERTGLPNCYPSQILIEEKIGDILVYFLLQKIMMLDHAAIKGR